MATALASTSGSVPIIVDKEELSDEQIEELLRQATIRLQNESKAITSSAVAEQRRQAAKLDTSALPQPYVQADKEIARLDERRLLDEKQRQSASGVRKVEDPVALKQKKLTEKKATAGSNWFNLPRTNLTPELKKDLQLLKMRSVLDPKRFYKKESTKSKPPEFSQVGTLVEGPTEFFSGRLTNTQRKRTLVEETLAGEEANGRFKRKYQEIQAAKTSGKKGHYKAVLAKRKSGSLRR